jgi:hypothetical protein
VRCFFNYSKLSRIKCKFFEKFNIWPSVADPGSKRRIIQGCIVQGTEGTRTFVRGYFSRRRIDISPCQRWNVSPSPTDVSPTKNSWMWPPLDKVSLGYFSPDRTIPSLNSDLIERSETQLSTVARFSTAKWWSLRGVLCVGRACIRRRAPIQ